MEPLEATVWDVLIAGTDLQQSLLALALSRSGKKVLHVDKNNFYGGLNAALSLQEANDWVSGADTHDTSTFTDAIINVQSDASDGPTKLSFSRAYNLSLSPQIIYTRSALLPNLVSSKIYRQLEFQAVGVWWIYEPMNEGLADISSNPTKSKSSGSLRETQAGILRKVPNGREDVFADKTINLRSKRSLMKFLKFVMDYENQLEVWESEASSSFPSFLSLRFNLPVALQNPLLALTLSSEKPHQITTGFALPRIARHLRSIGKFGPGFGSVIAKWGGSAEIAQVACRAAAVGGAVYILGNGIRSIKTHPNSQEKAEESSGSEKFAEINLTEGEQLKVKWVVIGERDTLPFYKSMPHASSSTNHEGRLDQCRSVSVVSSSLSSLYPILAEGTPSPAVSMVVFPSGSLSGTASQTHTADTPPVFILVHSSDTGECPSGQCVLYANVSTSTGEDYDLLDTAIERLLYCVGQEEQQPPVVLWSMRYRQRGQSSASAPNRKSADIISQPNKISYEHTLVLPSPSLDLVFDDILVDQVRQAWRKITAEDPPSDFMVFDDRRDLESDSNGMD